MPLTHPKFAFQLGKRINEDLGNLKQTNQRVWGTISAYFGPTSATGQIINGGYGFGEKIFQGLDLAMRPPPHKRTVRLKMN